MPRSPFSRYARAGTPRGSPQARFAPLLKNVGTPWAGGRRGCAPHPPSGLLLALRAAAGALLWRLPPALAGAAGDSPGRFAPAFGGPPVVAARPLHGPRAEGARGRPAGRSGPAARPLGLQTGEGEVHEQVRMRGELESLAYKEVSRFFTSAPQVSAK